nr:DUF1963 domain-containing protein [Spiractinospora alimapuensis]
MRFIAQVRLPGPDVRLAYLFMDDPDFYDSHDRHEPKEKYAVVVQPDGAPLGVATVPLPQGPTLRGYRRDGSEGEPVELAVQIAPYDQPALSGEALDDWADGTEDDDADDEPPGIQLGGRPHWLQGAEPPGDDWPLLLQIDSAGVVFGINCGDAGIAYAFLDSDYTRGVFFVQSC